MIVVKLAGIIVQIYLLECVNGITVLNKDKTNKDVKSVRILKLNVPEIVPEGCQAKLECQYDLQGFNLHFMRWFKDNQEFYRYDSSDKSGRYSDVSGVSVDVLRSSGIVVMLDHITNNSSGRYRCEVTADDPSKQTVSDEKVIRSIYLLPNRPPKIIGSNNGSHVGDLVAVNCTSSNSRPRSQIKWFINGLPAPRNYIRGPWVKVSRHNVHSSTLQLSFVIEPNYFREGVLTLKT